ncbi:MAG TPA: DnaJ family domain-containing protein [Candidatus Limnocylindria bacterium]|jgi:hypothetical protein|nr:DnaJ family domain-containing protein [Candidatus Limnocylindria bacterium]
MDDATTPKLRRIERAIEEQLRELARMGDLSKLPGEGAPIVDADADAGESWAARHIARNAGLAPEWIELRREIAELRDRLVRRLRAHRDWLEDRAILLAGLPAERIVETFRATRDYDARVGAELETALRELNAIVARHNLKVPLALQIPSLSLTLLKERV